MYQNAFCPPSFPWHSRIFYGGRTISLIDIIAIFLPDSTRLSFDSISFFFIGMVLNSIFVRHRFGLFYCFGIDYCSISTCFFCRCRVQLDHRAILILCFVCRRRVENHIIVGYRCGVSFVVSKPIIIVRYRYGFSFVDFVYRYRIETDNRSISIRLFVYRYRIASNPIIVRHRFGFLFSVRYRTRLSYRNRLLSFKIDLALRLSISNRSIYRSISIRLSVSSIGIASKPIIVRHRFGIRVSISNSIIVRYPSLGCVECCLRHRSLENPRLWVKTTRSWGRIFFAVRISDKVKVRLVPHVIQARISQYI